MSGHSKWSTIKHKKAANDSRRGKLFSKLVKEITAAARVGGRDIDMNPRLRTAIAAAKSSNVPNDNIEKAVLRGTGELEGETYEEILYEGYGPGGVALMIEVLTDNRNRAVADIRHAFSKHEGSIGERGCVAWGFDKCGLIVVTPDSIDEEELFLIAVEAGAEDVTASETGMEIITPFETFDSVLTAVQETSAEIQLAEISMIPQNTVKLEGKEAERMLRLMDALDELDDVQKVYANFDIPDNLLEAAA
ncbi:YebC/PmpR family DNA-binding transcriptional regulator [Candidatus Poribacteria bacterium]|nr:YebC/PmpR family DNA-binding transcriptional regulator [Candidatus Poribacteria bacterium]MXV84772.1 YebC/PmpR family DNA-binding transcriptional regulator [Candidatus Poribacteria bacterium]MYA55986.1 YebC/PmpR family DNA-binding transcriptional regulator [Candidatus Poribacteria bacterium]